MQNNINEVDTWEKPGHSIALAIEGAIWGGIENIPPLIKRQIMEEEGGEKYEEN